MLELTFQYRPLFKLEIFHDYYENQKIKNIQNVPLNTSLHLINRLGLIFKSTESGFELLIDHTKKDAFKMRILEEKSILFEFWMISTNPYFSNITKNSDFGLNKIFAFTNESGSDKEPIPLHKEEYASSNNLVTLFNGEIQLENSNKLKLVEIKDKFGTVIQQYENLSPQSSISPAPIGEGYFELWVDNKLKETYINLPFKRPRYPVALVQLVLDAKMIKTILKNIEHGESIPKFEFNISFKNQETYWRYKLVSKYIKNIEKAVILVDDKKAGFEGPEIHTLPNGQIAHVFQSKNPLILKEFSPHVFQLNRKNGSLNSFEKTLVKRLPVPAIDSLNTQLVKDEQRIYSDIIVYL